MTKLKYLMLKQDISARKLCRTLEIPSSMFGRIEQNVFQMNLRPQTEAYMSRISKFFKRPIEELLSNGKIEWFPASE